MHNYRIAGNFGKVFNLAICQYLNNVMTTCAHAHVNKSSANSAKLDCLLARNLGVKQNRLSGINVTARVLSG